MWMVQNDDGRYLDFNYVTKAHEFLGDHYGFVYGHTTATEMMKAYGGHLVEMVPAKPKVPVSQEEAELIDGITNDTDAYPASGIHDFVVDHFDDGSVWPSEQFRLMEAAIDGYTVVEPTRYNVKVPHMAGYFYCKWGDGRLSPATILENTDTQFTEAEIKHYGLEDCKRVEIDTEDSDDD
jgi:hypothetical protein